MRIIDAMGDACPIPVVKTKNAIRELGTGGGSVRTLVDNEIAVQNLTKMAVQKGYEVNSEKLEEGRFQVTMVVPGELAETPAADTSGNDPAQTTGTNMTGNVPSQSGRMNMPENTFCQADSRRNTVVVISSKVMGSGDEQLGAALMKSFIFALSQQEELPETILFYNSGAFLTCGESPMVEDLKSLEAQGVEILTCGTCLNHYGLTDSLSVGSVTNMYVIVEKQMQADKVIKP